MLGLVDLGFGAKKPIENEGWSWRTKINKLTRQMTIDVNVI